MSIKSYFLLTFVFLGLNTFSQSVFINNFNYKYHTKDCKKVKPSYYPVDLKDASKNNYKPCNECHPPTELVVASNI